MFFSLTRRSHQQRVLSGSSSRAAASKSGNLRSRPRGQNKPNGGARFLESLRFLFGKTPLKSPTTMPRTRVLGFWTPVRHRRLRLRSETSSSRRRSWGRSFASAGGFQQPIQTGGPQSSTSLATRPSKGMLVPQKFRCGSLLWSPCRGLLRPRSKRYGWMPTTGTQSWVSAEKQRRTLCSHPPNLFFSTLPCFFNPSPFQFNPPPVFFNTPPFFFNPPPFLSDPPPLPFNPPFLFCQPCGRRLRQLH